MSGMEVTPYETIARENMAHLVMNGGFAQRVDSAGLPPLAPMFEDLDAGLHFHSVAEIRSTLPPVWIVSGVIQENTLVLVYGASGSGKTFLMLDLAMSIARGSRWFGRRVRKGGVIYVAGEGNLKPRVDAYMTHHRISEEAVKGFRGLSRALNLRSGNDEQRLLIGLEKAAAEMGRVDLVVLDTLNALMAGGDENSSPDMGHMIAVARRIMTRLSCSVAYVHHPGKAEDRGPRGHSSLHGALDTEILVRGATDPRVALITKHREGAVGDELAYQLVPIDLGPSPDPEADAGDRYTSCVVEPAEFPKIGAAPLSPKEAILVRVLKDLCLQVPAIMSGADRAAAGIGAEQAVTTLAAWQETACGAGISTGSYGAKKKAFQRARDALVDKQCVKIYGNFGWIEPC